MRNGWKSGGWEGINGGRKGWMEGFREEEREEVSRRVKGEGKDCGCGGKEEGEGRT